MRCGLGTGHSVHVHACPRSRLHTLILQWVPCDTCTLKMAVIITRFCTMYLIACVRQVVVPDRASEAAEPASDVACFLFDLAGEGSPEERSAVVAVLRDALQRVGTTTVVNSHEVASMLRRSLGVAPANVFDCQACGPVSSDLAPLPMGQEDAAFTGTPLS